MSADQNLSAGQFYRGTVHHIPLGDSIRTRALPLEYAGCSIITSLRIASWPKALLSLEAKST